MRNNFKFFLISLVLLSWPFSVAAVDFYSFNDYLGICPLSKTLTYVSTKGSYAAYVIDPARFARICPDITSGTHITLKKLDQIHWLVQLDTHQIQFRFEDTGFVPSRGSAYKITKICNDCPMPPAGGTMNPAPDGMAVDKAGERQPAHAQEEEMVIFDFDKFQVKPPYYPIIDKLVAELKANPKLKVELRGHTCSIGQKLYNDKLSQKRAEAVKQYLLNKGIAVGRIVTRGYGYAKPFASNGTPDGRSQNRRVRLVKR